MGWVFLFAASRDVQRDYVLPVGAKTECFYSLHRETYSVTTRSSSSRAPSRFYSLHRETYSVTKVSHRGSH